MEKKGHFKTVQTEAICDNQATTVYRNTEDKDSLYHKSTGKSSDLKWGIETKGHRNVSVMVNKETSNALGLI